MAESSLLMTTAQLTDSVSGDCLCDYTRQNGFTSVATDSRNVLPLSLFIPLRGETQDGHSYIPKAMEMGAVIVLADKAHALAAADQLRTLGKKYNACVIIVENNLHALQDAARTYISFFPNLLKIGITGSSGKTTTKEITASIFAQKYSVVMNEGNLNSETGLPLSVFKIRAEHEAGIFELGMNRRGEIAEIARVLSPSLALITNIGTAHIGILGTQQAIAEEKKEIFSFFDSDGLGFIPEGDPWYEFLSIVPSGKIRPYGPSTTEGFEGSESLGIDGTLIHYKGKNIRFALPGEYNLRNALASISLAQSAGVTPEQIKDGIERVQPLFGRTQVIHGEITILMDCYNANPDSMESALEFCIDVEWSGNKIYVLASMLELGDESSAAHAKICRIASKSGMGTFYLFGEDMIAAGRSTEWGKTDVSFCASIDELSSALSAKAKPGDLVFLKGSRGMALERVCPVLTGRSDTGNCHG